MNAKRTFAEHLMSMPNVGDDADFERVQDIGSLEGMIDQMNKSTSRAKTACAWRGITIVGVPGVKKTGTTVGDENRN